MRRDKLSRDRGAMIVEEAEELAAEEDVTEEEEEAGLPAVIPCAIRD
jgi:hypothetical protein